MKITISFHNHHLKLTVFLSLVFLISLYSSFASPSVEDIDSCHEVKVRVQKSEGSEKDLEDLYEFERQAMVEKLKPVLPNIEEFKIESKISEVEAELYFLYRNKKEKLWREIPSPDHATYFNYSNEKNHLTITDQQIHPKYREKGLSKIATLYLIKKHPDTLSLHANLVETNAASFFVALIEGSKNPTIFRQKSQLFLKNSDYESEIGNKLKKIFLNTKSGSPAKKLKNQLIENFFENTPAGRIRSALGFQNLSQLVIVFNQRDSEYTVRALVEKGKLSTYEKVEITIEWQDESRSVTTRIYPDGSMQRQAGS